MLSDYELITHRFPERPDLRIFPVCDVHLGALEHMAKEWDDFRAQILADPNARIVIGGDLLNNATRTSLSNIFEETMRPREQKRVMVEMLEPLRDRILCMVTGNHERRNKDVDNDPSYDIACKLDIEHLYRENIAFVRVQMGELNGAGKLNPTYILAITHGTGGGVLTGGVVNRGERFGYVLDGCDALIFGHSHKPFVTQPAKIAVDPHNNRVSLKPFKVVSATSWLQWGGYAAQKMLLPTSYAPQMMMLYGTKKEIRVEM